MRRLAWVLLLAAAPAGCIDHDREIIVQNCGDETIIVDVEKEFNPWSCRRDDHLQTPVLGFSSWAGRYTSSLERITLVVRRNRDGVLLYSGRFGLSDFEDAKNHILIPVYP
jgi:hypothetical protein